MPRTVKDYMDSIEKVIGNIPNETISIINSKSEQIIDLNRDDQLYDLGINSDGNLLRHYSNTTILFKKQEGKPYNRTTLFDKGDFYRGFKIKVNYPTISIYSTDHKSSELIDKYGTNIFGLIKENQLKLNYEILKPELLKYIKQWL